MSALRLARLIRRTGRVAEPAPPAPEAGCGGAGHGDVAHGEAGRGEAGRGEARTGDGDGFRPDPALAGSAQVRHVDCGSCNGCEIEVGAVFGPVYDAERYGVRLVASPRHADVLLVTGVVTRNMHEPLRRTVEATPRPRVVVAVGDCAVDGGMFRDGYGVVGSVDDVVAVDLGVPGCPPEPAEIVAALRRVTGR